MRGEEDWHPRSRGYRDGSATYAPLVSVDLVRWGADRLRVGPWRGNERIAYVAPVADGAPTTTDAVRRCCDVLAGRGFEQAVTAALGPAESRGFFEAGFAVRERLHLLAHDLLDLPTAPACTLRRGRRTDRDAALAVDARSFETFWRLDGGGFDEAMAATPSSRFRIAVTGDDVIAYAVSGRAGPRGFLQRLAVDPSSQRHGFGFALAVDGLRWMKRRGVDRAMVNTQEHNDGALALYQRLGFRLQPGGLAVLQIALA
jgi:ribosomal protein S18 acetylase RimI-like enzyme